MPVVLARIDDRLLHGQVLEGWAPHVKADTIVVASDTVFQEKDRCQLMQLIVPDHVDLKVIPLVELGGLLDSMAGSRLLILFSGLDDVLTVLDNGVWLDSINVGNLHNIKGGTEITPSVYLNSRDMEAIRLIIDKGIEIVAREVPHGDTLDLATCLDEQDGSR